MRSRALVPAFLLISLLVLSVRYGNAWTFSFELGEAKNQWGYMQYGQKGTNGFFGPYDQDASGAAGLYGNLNSWVGNRLPDVGEITSGSNATNSQLGLTVDPGVKNEWIKVTGRYNINLYEAATSQGAFNPMAPTALTMWSCQVDLPIFRLGYGKRPFQAVAQALGLQFGPNRTQEYLVIEQDALVPDILGYMVAGGFLPRGVLSWFNPAAWGRYKSELEDTDPVPDTDAETWPKQKGSFAGGMICPATLKFGVGSVPWQRIDSTFSVGYNPQDVSAGMEQNWIAYLLYTSTDLSVGIGTTRTTFHAGPELVASNTAPFFIRSHTPTQEVYLTEGWAFFSFNNGRLFCSAELDWYNRIRRFQKTADGFVYDPVTSPVSGLLLPEVDPLSGVSQFAPQYRESWRFLVEAGIFFGPSTLKGMFAYMPGQDRRHGILIDRQPFIQSPEQAAFTVFDPYSMHLNYLFGAGVNAPAHIAAATAWGVKSDYMLASNLLVFGTFFKAVRNAHGYGFGFIRPSVQGLAIPDGAFGTVNYNIRGNYAASPPSIPDNDLGWEATTGITWQLAAGCYVDARFSYWQPGKWFSYACIDRTVPGWTVPTPLNNWGVNSDRIIDPVYGIELRVAAAY